MRGLFRDIAARYAGQLSVLMTEDELREKWAESLEPKTARPKLKEKTLIRVLDVVAPRQESRGERRRRLTRLGEQLDIAIYLRWQRGERCAEIAADLGLERETVEQVVEAFDA